MIDKIIKNNFIVNVKAINYRKLTDLFRERKFSPTLCQGYLDRSLPASPRGRRLHRGHHVPPPQMPTDGA